MEPTINSDTHYMEIAIVAAHKNPSKPFGAISWDKPTTKGLAETASFHFVCYSSDWHINPIALPRKLVSQESNSR